MSTDSAASSVIARASAGVLDVSGRTRLVLTGPDRATWLQGMVTADVSKLQPNEGCAATTLNNKGKILGDLRLYVRPDEIWLDAEGSRRGPLLEHLSHFIIMEDCELKDGSDALASLAVVGAKAWDIARVVFPELTPLEPAAQLQLGEVVAAGWPELGLPGVRFWLAPTEREALQARLVAAGAVPLDAAAVDVLRIEAGRPREGAELDDDVIPLEAGLESAISDTKGCYLGQEVIARISHRGHVNRKLVGFALQGAAPALPAALTRDGKPVGELRSAVWSPALGKVIGLGYLRRELIAPGAVAALPDGTHATLAELPFVK